MKNKARHLVFRTTPIHGRRSQLIHVLLSLGLMLCATTSFGQSVMDCGRLANLENAYGPFDYTNSTHFIEKLPRVERAHFTPDVEGLIRGQSGSIINDIDYTLRAFPNHHRALYALSRYRLREPLIASGSARHEFPAECYFNRAIRFRPDDHAVHLIYAIFLHQKGELQEARNEYDTALSLKPDSVETQYNLGLLFVDMKQYDNALQHAVDAYRQGYPLQGLKNRLIKAGVWNDSLLVMKPKDTDG